MSMSMQATSAEPGPTLGEEAGQSDSFGSLERQADHNNMRVTAGYMFKVQTMGGSCG